MIKIVDAKGEVIHRSKNLRGVFDHARRTFVREACAYPGANGKGLLQVQYGDGAYCETEFASYRVLCEWLNYRRSWAGVRSIDSGPAF